MAGVDLASLDPLFWAVKDLSGTISLQTNLLGKEFVLLSGGGVEKSRMESDFIGGSSLLKVLNTSSGMGVVLILKEDSGD